MIDRGHTRRAERHGAGRRPGVVALALLAALAACLGLAATAAAAPGDVVWRDFSQRAAGGDDAYHALAVTSRGDVYVVGSTTSRAGAEQDVLVRKVSLGGKALWRRIWTYPGRSADVARDAVRDRSGNVVVAGSSGSSWLLLKYRSDGYLQWVRRGRAPYAHCELTAVTVDGSGNVFATGAATPAGEARRYFTIKYSAAGAFRWRTSLGSVAGDAAAADIVIGAGDVYVTGVFATGATARKSATVKYSGTGKRRWIAYHPADTGAVAQGLAIAYASGPYVMGTITVPGGRDDGFVVRYTPDGAPRWVAAYTGPYDLGDRFNAMVVDGSGGACVTGSRLTGAGEEMLTMRFSALGLLEWEHPVTGGAAEGSAVCHAEGGAYYSAGGTAGTIVTQDTGSGLPGWMQIVAPAGYLAYRPAAIQASGDKAVYVAGWAQPAGGGSAAMLVRLRP